MATRRKIKVRVRGKVRNRVLRRGGLAAGAALGLLLAAWLGGTAWRSLRRPVADKLSFKPDAFEVDCPSAQAEATLRELAGPALKRALSSRAAAELEREIKRRHPGLAAVEVTRNFITRKAVIRAVPEEAVAPVLADGATAYLGVTGRLMPEDLSGKGEAPFAVELRGAPRKAPHLAAFVADLKRQAGLFYSRPSALRCAPEPDGCRLRLEDGSEVLWGGFEFTRLKILRLNEVMRDALLKSGGPLRADLRSFREGKIFVSAVRQP